MLANKMINVNYYFFFSQCKEQSDQERKNTNLISEKGIYLFCQSASARREIQSIKEPTPTNDILSNGKLHSTSHGRDKRD